MIPIQLIKGEIDVEKEFHKKWSSISKIVTEHSLWKDIFMTTIKYPEKDPQLTWLLVRKWTEQMYHGSLAFPR